MNETKTSDAARPTIVQSGEGQTLKAFGDMVQIKLGGAQTAGSLAVGLALIPPGGGPPSHVHHNEDELFLILEGRFSLFANGEWTELGPGGIGYTPRGNVHTFRNIGDTTGRLWVLTPAQRFRDVLPQVLGGVRRRRISGHAAHPGNLC